MNRLRLWPAAAAVVVSVIVGVLAVSWAATRPVPGPDILLSNHVVQAAQEHWPEVSSTDIDRPGLALSITDNAGNVVLRQHDAPVADREAALAGAGAYAIQHGGQIVGRLYLIDPGVAEAEAARSRLVWWTASAAIVLVAAIALAVLAGMGRRLLGPFKEMQRWAVDVANGDLSQPLRMRRGNAFGAFTESFDLMRTELAASRARERAVQEQSRVLIAQLGHDIRTPVASMAAQAEVLRIDESDPGRRSKLDTIVAKSEQIRDLLAELFSANKSEMAALPMKVTEHYSVELVELLRLADSHNRLRLEPVPDCLVRYDPQRIQQVLDNVLTNAEKYAGTEVRATWVLDDEQLLLRLADSGPGVSQDDLAVLLVRGARGSNVGERPGQGLGLHLAATLMERMGGSLAVANLSDGFAVDLALPLA